MEHIWKKLREARFFLGKMDDRTGMAAGDHEEFDFHLSACLSAGYSVADRLCNHPDSGCGRIWKSWRDRQSEKDRKFIAFMRNERNAETHRKPSSRKKNESKLPISGSYRDPSCEITVSEPPGAMHPNAVPSTVTIWDYTYDVAEQILSVNDCCRRYCELLEQLIRECETSQTGE